MPGIVEDVEGQRMNALSAANVCAGWPSDHRGYEHRGKGSLESAALRLRVAHVSAG